MQTTPTSIERTLCPLCGGDNLCAMEVERATGVSQAPCWCTTQSFTAGLLARLPAGAEGKACICGRCLTRFKQATVDPGSPA